MQLSVPALARATWTSTTTTSGRGGKFSSGTSPSLFVVRRRRIRRSEREAKRTNATPRALFNNNNDGKRTRRAKPKPLQQGDLTKKRCDACLGTGKIPCYNCTRRTSGWESGGAGNASGVKAISVADKVGYVPAKKRKQSLFSLPFGWKTTTTTTTTDESDSKNKKEEEEALVRCPVCETVPGKLVCGRCNGQGSLLYRSADWR